MATAPRGLSHQPHTAPESPYLFFLLINSEFSLLLLRETFLGWLCRTVPTSSRVSEAQSSGYNPPPPPQGMLQQALRIVLPVALLVL